LFAITLVLPPLSAGLTGLPARLAVLGCCAGAVAATWMALVRPDAATIGEWCVISMVMACYGTALAGIVALLDRIRIAPPLSSGIAIIMGVAWLTWPVWLSPWMAMSASESIINILVAFHPPLVCNGILTFTPPWTEQSMAYALTVLGQDVPLRLPTNALPCVGFHLVVAAIAFLLGIIPIAGRSSKRIIKS